MSSLDYSFLCNHLLVVNKLCACWLIFLLKTKLQNIFNCADRKLVPKTQRISRKGKMDRNICGTMPKNEGWGTFSNADLFPGSNILSRKELGHTKRMGWTLNEWFKWPEEGISMVWEWSAVDLAEKMLKLTQHFATPLWAMNCLSDCTYYLKSIGVVWIC